MVVAWTALLTALVALVNVWLARRQLSLATAEGRRKDPAINVCLAKARIKHLPSEHRRLYVFSLVVTNKSIVANSIKEIVLVIESGQQGQATSTINVPHTPSTASVSSVSDSECFKTPFSIGAGETVSGIALFSVRDNLVQGMAIESYRVRLTDGHDRQALCKAILLREY